MLMSSVNLETIIILYKALNFYTQADLQTFFTVKVTSSLPLILSPFNILWGDLTILSKYSL